MPENDDKKPTFTEDVDISDLDNMIDADSIPDDSDDLNIEDLDLDLSKDFSDFKEDSSDSGEGIDEFEPIIGDETAGPEDLNLSLEIDKGLEDLPEFSEEETQDTGSINESEDAPEAETHDQYSDIGIDNNIYITDEEIKELDSTLDKEVNTDLGNDINTEDAELKDLNIDDDLDLNVDFNSEKDSKDVNEKDLNLKDDLGLLDQLSLSEDEDLNLEEEEFKYNLVDDEGQPLGEGESEEEFGVDLKSGPETIESPEDAEAFSPDELINDEDYQREMESDQDVELISIPEKEPNVIDDEQDEFLKSDIDETELDDQMSQADDQLADIRIEDEKFMEPDINDNIDADDFSQDETINEGDIKPEEDIGDFNLDEDLLLDVEKNGESTDVNKDNPDMDEDFSKVLEEEIPENISEANELDLDLNEEISHGEELHETPNQDIDRSKDEEEISLDLAEFDVDDIPDISSSDLELDESTEEFKESNTDNGDMSIDFETEEGLTTDLKEFEMETGEEQGEEFKPEKFKEEKEETSIDLENEGDTSQDEFINLDETDQVDEEFDLDKMEKIPSILDNTVEEDEEEIADMSLDNIEMEDESDSLKLEEADLSDIENKIFPDDESMPELDEDISSTKLTGEGNELSNSISPLTDAGEVIDYDENIEFEEVSDEITLDDIDLENIPEHSLNLEEEDTETIGLSGEELDNIIKDTDTDGKTGDMQEIQDEDNSETIDMATFDAELNEVGNDELELIEIDKKEEKEFGDLRKEMQEKSKGSVEIGSDAENLKTNVKKILKYLDQLLDALPEEKIKEFAQSEEFDLYKNLFDELGIAE